MMNRDSIVLGVFMAGLLCLFTMSVSLVNLCSKNAAYAQIGVGGGVRTGAGSLAATPISTSGMTTIDQELIYTGRGGTTTFEVCNTGTAGLTEFYLQRQVHSTSSWVTWLQDTDWDTATSTLLSVSGTGPHEINSNSVIDGSDCAQFDVKPHSSYAIRFQAQAVDGDNNNDATAAATIAITYTIGPG
jgi:hypothetical protein